MKILRLQTMFVVATFVTSSDANICRCPRESTSVLELAPEKERGGTTQPITSRPPLERRLHL